MEGHWAVTAPTAASCRKAHRFLLPVQTFTYAHTDLSAAPPANRLLVLLPAPPPPGAVAGYPGTDWPAALGPAVADCWKCAAGLEEGVEDEGWGAVQSTFRHLTRSLDRVPRAAVMVADWEAVWLSRLPARPAQKCLSRRTLGHGALSTYNEPILLDFALK
eukprot:269300-Pelagomonas_calceolata.AAC.21